MLKKSYTVCSESSGSHYRLPMRVENPAASFKSPNPPSIFPHPRPVTMLAQLHPGLAVNSISLHQPARSPARDRPTATARDPPPPFPTFARHSPSVTSCDPDTTRSPPGHGTNPTGRSWVLPGTRPEARRRPHNNRLFDPANGPLLVKFRENPLDARTDSRQPAGRFTPRAGPVPLIVKSHPRRTQISGNIPIFPAPQKKRPR